MKILIWLYNACLKNPRMSLIFLIGNVSKRMINQSQHPSDVVTITPFNSTKIQKLVLQSS
jgi:hypothetical protein